MEREYLNILNIVRSSRFILIFLQNFEVSVKITFFPSSILGNIYPYEVLYDKLLDYSTYKTFGTLCYASILLSGRHIFSPKATTTIFIYIPSWL